MQKRAMWAVLAVCLGVVACTQQTAVPGAESPPAAATPALVPITAQGVLDAFTAAGLPLQDVHVYTAENDPNSLLGRPGQYIGKASWNDGRHPADDPDGANTIEVFPDEAAMIKRRDYIASVTGDNPMLLQYMQAHRNALVRLDKQVTPDQAAEYKRVLEVL